MIGLDTRATSVFEFRAAPTDHASLNEAVADFRRSLQRALPCGPQMTKQEGRFVTSASLVAPYDYSVSVFGLTSMTDDQFFRLLSVFRETWCKASELRNDLGVAQ